MSLYRQPGAGRGRAALVGGAVGLLVGLGGGLAIGAGGDEDQSLRPALSALRGDLRDSRNALELVSIEYRQAVRGGRVVARTEYAAARADVARARSSFSAARSDAAVLAPRAVRRVEVDLRRVATLVAARADAAAVDAAVRAAERNLDAVLPR